MAPSAIQPFLDAGISVAAINYRFIPQAMEQKVEPPVKACLHDAARALQTIRSKAKEWNLDPKRVGATGGSAGACTSLWLALHDDLADPQASDPIARQSSRLTCAAVNGAQTSLDPKELREWIPNAIYGGHAFGFAAPGRSRPEEFELLIANREKVLAVDQGVFADRAGHRGRSADLPRLPQPEIAAQAGPEGSRPDALGHVRRQAGREAQLGRRGSRRVLSGPRGREVRLDQEVPDREAPRK